jgi:glycerate kinase
VTLHALVCPDKFKGTLEAPQAGEAMRAGLERAGIDRIRTLPLADGGEGTLDALVAARGGTRQLATVSGPLGRPVRAEWAMLPGGVAVVEMARASGLALTSTPRDPLRASSRGTGELVAAAIRAGARQVIVGVGGSASTDGGFAALDALSWSLGTVPVIVACDVTTPFLEAATVFAPQKGASAAQVTILSRRLARLAHEYEQRTGVDVRTLPGAGAAGGLAGGLAAIGAVLRPGFDVVAGAVGLDDTLADVDLVITGEGCLDATSFAGKVVGGVVARAADAGVGDVGVIVGDATGDARHELAQRSRAQLLALTDRVADPSDAFSNAAALVEEAALAMGRRVVDADRRASRT